MKRKEIETTSISKKTKIGSTAAKNQKKYVAGIYARLSVDKQNEKNESIETQIELAKEFLSRQEDIELYDCYIDLGKTGSSFEREEFKRFMQDVRENKVNCMIVKDLSRFGRNYMEVGNYLEKIFPFLGVRFISITDDFDTLDKNHDLLSINLKNLVNELYAKDIGRKVQLSRQIKWKQGSYIGGMLPYGYRAEWKDKKRLLIIDTEASNIVKKIYEMYVQQKTQKDIIAWLYEKKIHRPSDYHKTGNIYQNAEEELKKWDRGTIRGILANPVYLGNLQFNSCEKKLYPQIYTNTASNTCFINEHTHEPIISEEIFTQATKRLKNQKIYYNKKEYSKCIPINKDIFHGLLFCGECQKPMTRISNIREKESGQKVCIYTYVCKNTNCIEKANGKRSYISFETLIEIIRISMKMKIALSGLKTSQVINICRKVYFNREKQILKQKEEQNKRIFYCKQQQSEQYLKYVQGKIDQDTFIRQKQEKEKQIEEWKRLQEENDKKIKELNIKEKRQRQLLYSLFQLEETSKLDKALLNYFLQRIDIFPEKRLEIQYLFSDFKGF